MSWHAVVESSLNGDGTLPKCRGGTLSKHPFYDSPSGRDALIEYLSRQNEDLYDKGLASPAVDRILFEIMLACVEQKPDSHSVAVVAFDKLAETFLGRIQGRTSIGEQLRGLKDAGCDQARVLSYCRLIAQTQNVQWKTKFLSSDATILKNAAKVLRKAVTTPQSPEFHAGAVLTGTLKPETLGIADLLETYASAIEHFNSVVKSYSRQNHLHVGMIRLLGAHIVEVTKLPPPWILIADLVEYFGGNGESPDALRRAFKRANRPKPDKTSP